MFKGESLMINKIKDTTVTFILDEASAARLEMIEYFRKSRADRVRLQEENTI